MRTSPARIDTSAAYAAEVARLLWPEPWATPSVTRKRHRTGLAHRDAYVFPSVRRPRLLVPADVPGSASMLQRIGKDQSRLAGPLRGLVERSVGSRAFALTRWPMLRVAGSDPGADSIENHLAGCFGTEVRVGVRLGTRRANQKPVLQVFDREGQLLGFAKVGHNDLTATLVRREAQALATVGSHVPRSFRLPELIHHGHWAGLEVLAMSPLPSDRGQPVTPGARLAAMRELAGLARTRRAPLARTEFWFRLRGAASLVAGDPAGRGLPGLVGAIEDRHGGDSLGFGGWHGDWGHWNMGMADGVLQLWDWERYDPEVPIGFDGLHFAAQRVRPGQRDAYRREEAFLASVPGVLSDLGVPSTDHDLTLRLYLLEIALRYVDAMTHGATPALRGRTSWALSLLEQLCESPIPATPEGRP